MEFTVRSGASTLSGYDMFFTVAGKDDWNVCLSWYTDWEVFYDNYMSWVLREEVEAVYLPLIYQVYEDCNVYNFPYGGHQSNLYTKIQQ